MIHPGLRSNVPMSIFIILTLSLLLARCGAERTMVVAPADTSDRFTEAEIVEDKSTVNVPSEVNSSFQAKLSQLISGQGGFVRGPGFKIKYRFIQFNPTNYFPYNAKNHGARIVEINPETTDLTRRLIDYYFDTSSSRVLSAAVALL